jgi:hypothetical protein
VSDSKKVPEPPPDDFSKTTPNIKVPDADTGHADWDKTNYNFPRQPAADDWGKTPTLSRSTPAASRRITVKRCTPAPKSRKPQTGA